MPLTANFIVEDGTGLSNSNAYIQVNDFYQYFLDRGTDYQSTYTTAQVQTAIVKASMYIDQCYRLRFKGYKVTKGQNMAWPRIGVVEEGDGAGYFIAGVGEMLDGFVVFSNEVPLRLKWAVSEAALLALQGETFLPTIPAGAGAVGSITAGGVSKTYQIPPKPYKTYRQIELWLTDLLKFGNESRPIVRA